MARVRSTSFLLSILNLVQKGRLIISINLFSSSEEMNPITPSKDMSKLEIQPTFRAVGQNLAELQTFEKPENKREMYGSQSTQALLPYNTRQMYGS